MSTLIELQPGPMPIIPKKLWAEIQDWLSGWKHAEALREAKLQAPGALLLHGPTGSGKTSLARAILKHMPGRPGYIMEAHNTLSSFFSESGSKVASAFQQAEANEALLVIEEIDALGISRDNNRGMGAQEENKITIALMRCLEDAKVPVIATTNFKGSLDSALLRRFEMQVEVPEADAKCRALILKKILEVDPPDELVALPLVESIRLAHRMRRQSFIAAREGRADG